MSGFRNVAWKGVTWFTLGLAMISTPVGSPAQTLSVEDMLAIRLGHSGRLQAPCGT
jgi:hypothetical protein